MKAKKRGALITTALIAAGTLWGTTSTAKTPPIESNAPVALPCGDVVPAMKNVKKQRQHEDSIRASAQKGLNFLTQATIEWQSQNQCMGCHVQGVTGEALAVGKHHQYEVADKDIDTVFSGILDLSGGLRSNEGHAVGQLRASTRAFGGASVARYDMWVNEQYGDDLINTAQDLLTHQSENGDISLAYNTGIAAKGPLQGTYQAIQTWQQAYARTADDRWLTAIGKSEAFLQRTIDAWYEAQDPDVQHINFALLGLLAAGIGSTEKVAVDLRDKLLAAQNPDGGFPDTIGSTTSSALTTGQTLYTLRRLGMNDGDKQVSAATMFVIEAQQPDGGWSDSGGEKAEAMWAVLGLVSTDVLSVNVAGIKNGQHIDGKTLLKATATDNEGAGVRKIEIAIDDELVGGACADQAAHSFDASKLSSGMHTIDITAFNAQGKEARRRLTVYAGDHFITNVGTKYSDGGTLLSLRDIAPTDLKHNVELEILQNGKKLHTMTQTGAQGPLAFHWKGEMKGEEAAKHGDYTARIRIKDATGKVRQTHEMPFVHDTPEAQANNYAQVAGRIQFAEDDADVENATIELVDERGNIVQSTRSTKSGSYRFRNVKSAKKYKVRVKKNGKADKEMDLAAPAAAAEEQKADFAL